VVAAPAPGILVEPLGPIAVGVLPWAHQRAAGPPRHFLTIVARVAFSLHERGECRLAPAERLEDRDRVPVLPRAEVLLEGRCPAVGTDVVAHLRVTRAGHDLAIRRATVPVRDGMADLGALAGRAPDSPERVALLRGLTAPSADDPVLIVPRGLDLTYYQSAPLDQRLDALHGDEVIEIGGLGAPPTPLVVRLPQVHAAAMVMHLAGRTGPVPVALAVDTVRIEMPACRVVVLLRGNCPIGSRESFQGLGVAARLESPVAGPPFPTELRSLAGRSPARTAPAGGGPSASGPRTAAFPTPPGASALPFEPIAAPRPPGAVPRGPDPLRGSTGPIADPPSSAPPDTKAPSTADRDEVAPPASMPFVKSRGPRSSRSRGADAAPRSRRSSRAAIPAVTAVLPVMPAPPSPVEPSPETPRVTLQHTAPSLITREDVEAARAWAATQGLSAPLPPATLPFAPAGTASAPPPAPAPRPPPAAPMTAVTPLAPAVVVAPAPAAARSEPPPRPLDPRGAGALARGRGADFLRALAAVEDE
jgi:hypothetical protein